MKTILFTSLIVMLSVVGCRSDDHTRRSEQTRPGSMVRTIDMNYAQSCTFLGSVEGTSGWGMTPAGDRRKAIANLREEVAALGGNAYTQVDMSSNNVLSSTQGDAYRCDQLK